MPTPSLLDRRTRGAAFSSVADAGDVNGDGFADLIVGAVNDGDGGARAGAAYLVLGPITGTLELQQADFKFVGEVADDLAGSRVASAGDIDNDGLGDVLIVAEQHDEGGTDAGAAYLLYGANL